MLTVFSIPQAFHGPIGVIQRNALASWRRLSPRPEVILYGNDEGVAAAAREFGVRHEPELARNAYGTPLVSDAFARAMVRTATPCLMYSNADMLYDQSLYTGLEGARRLPQFLLSGRRWDVDVADDLAAAGDEAWRVLFANRAARGRLHGPAGMDFFVFPRNLPLEMPPLAVGRVAWDSWLVWRCRMARIPVIDATRTVTALHQNHGYSHLPLGYQHSRGPERDLNIRAAGGLSHMLTLREADRHLVAGRLVSPPWSRRLPACLATRRAYQKLLAVKRTLA